MVQTERDAVGVVGVRRLPTIKGIFVNSHVKAVRKLLGNEGVRELERRMGHPVDYGDTHDVLVRDEVRLIEYALDLTTDRPIDPGFRAFEAGRLHFRNFTTTPWAKMLFTLFPRNFHYMVKHAPLVAERVFKGVRFRTRDLNPRTLIVNMENNDYPIDHFRGLFSEWLEFFGETGQVSAQDLGDGRYEYLIELDP